MGVWFDVYEKKLSYAKIIKSKKKIVIVAGSNGIFSHRCSEIKKIVGLECVNASTGALSGIDFILEKSKEFISPSDIVILPLEYNFYTLDENQIINSTAGNNYIAQYEREYLLKMGDKKILPILFSFNFQYLFSSLVEMALNACGVERRFGVDTINANGDMINHTKEKGFLYSNYVNSLNQARPSERLLTDTTFSSQVIIADYLKWCSKNKVKVFGSLPTTFDDRKNNPKALMKIKNLYYLNGAGFIETDNNSQYARKCFYDTSYHLNEECQIIHSKKIADYLKYLH